MNTLLASSLHAAALASTLFAFTVSAHAQTTDRAAALLTGRGTIPVAAAGPYVEVGTFLIQVSTKLGQPSAKLADGTWLYENYAAEESAARGTLVVRFTKGRVASLALAGPAVVAALRTTSAANGALVAGNGRR